MNIFVELIFMITTGAAIGGIGNFLAIKMLFRPLRPIYIFKIKLPLTPGLIPRRRGKLAQQLGDLVIKYLLTPDGIMQKLKEHTFHEKMVNWSKNEMERLLTKEVTIKWIVEEKLQIKDLEGKVDGKIHNFLSNGVHKILSSLKERQVIDFITPSMEEKAEILIENMADKIVDKASLYFQSSEGKAKLKEVIEGFTKSDNMFKSMFSFILASDKVTEKAQKEIIQFIQKEETKSLIQSFLRKEWVNFKYKYIGEFTESIDEEKIVSYLHKKITSTVSFENWYEKTINELFESRRERIVSSLAPKVVEVSENFIVSKVPIILNELDLGNVVKEQVDSFPLEKVEELLMSIIKTELRSITYLGAFLGGLISIVQYFIIQIF